MFSPAHIYASIILVGFNGSGAGTIYKTLGENFKIFRVRSNLFEVFIVKRHLNLNNYFLIYIYLLIYV